jgi:predicted DNA-binding transcriptional regulator AlpA
MTTQQPTRSERAYWNVRDVAEHYGLGVSTVWRRVKDGTLPAPVKIGGATRWRRAEIEAAFSDAA